jgi:hypothetical protein
MGKEKLFSRRNSTYLTDVSNSDFVILCVIIIVIVVLLLIYKARSLEALSKFAKLNSTSLLHVHPLYIFSHWKYVNCTDFLAV